jgi:endonuclease G
MSRTLRIPITVTACAVISASASAQEIHIVHCFEGSCPTGAPATNDLVVREIFALSSNDDTKFADWVAYRVTSETIGTSADLNRGWETDDFLDEDETLEAGSGARDDYHGSNAAHGYDRGHHAPLASFAGTVFWRSTNTYSNITPQQADLNQGAWVALESAVRDLAYEQREVWVVTGPLYERPMPELANAGEAHQVPSGYWKVIVNRSGDAAAFVFDQETPRDADFCDHRETLEHIENQSGLVLFPSGDTEIGSLDASLGCSD